MTELKNERGAGSARRRSRRLFTEARTHNAFLDKPVPDELLHRGRRSRQDGADQRQSVAVARRLPPLDGGQGAAASGAVARQPRQDPRRAGRRHRRLRPRSSTSTCRSCSRTPTRKSWFSGNEAFAERSAFQNGTLQVAYLILALRAVGLDTGPMTGFDNAKVDAEFFPDGNVKSNVLINIGYGDDAKLFPRSPRFAFDQIAKIT